MGRIGPQAPPTIIINKSLMVVIGKKEEKKLFIGEQIVNR